ncbi:MAG: DUF4358 domain-containing protein [Butyrivibrio sp.]
MKKLTVLMCVLLMCLGVTACSGKGGTTASGSSGETSEVKVSCKEILDDILSEVTDTHNDSTLYYDDEKYGEYFEYLYDTSSKRVVDGAFAYASSAYADEITVLYAAEDKDTDTIVKHLENRIDKRMQDFNGYKPEEVAKLEKACIKTSGKYILMAVGDQSDRIEEIFLDKVGGK